MPFCIDRAIISSPPSAVHDFQKKIEMYCMVNAQHLVTNRANVPTCMYLTFQFTGQNSICNMGRGPGGGGGGGGGNVICACLFWCFNICGSTFVWGVYLAHYLHTPSFVTLITNNSQIERVFADDRSRYFRNVYVRPCNYR